MDDGADDPTGYDDFSAAQTVIFPARAVRRVRVLLGLIPLDQMTAAEVAAVLRDRVDAAV